MKFSITNITRYGKAYYKDVVELSEDAIDILLNTEHTFCIHNNNRRKNEDIKEINGIILDFDGKGDHVESSIADVMNSPLWEDNYCFIITSKSHGIAPRDCFHLYIPFSRSITKKEFFSKKSSIVDFIQSYNSLNNDPNFNMLGYVNASPKGKILYSSSNSLIDPDMFADGVVEDEYEISEEELNLNNTIIASDLDRVGECTSSFIMNTVGILQSAPNSPLRHRKGFVCNFRRLLTPKQWYACLGAIKSVFGSSESGRGLAILLSGTYTKNDGTIDTKETILEAYKSSDSTKFTIFTLIGVVSHLIKMSGNYRMYGQVSRYKKELMNIIGMSNVSPSEAIDEVIFTTGLRSRKVYTSNGSMYKSDVVDKIAVTSNLPSKFIDSTIKMNINNESVDNNIVTHIRDYSLSLIKSKIDEYGKIKTVDAKNIFDSVCDKYGYKNKTKHTVNFKMIREILLNDGYELPRRNDGHYFIKVDSNDGNPNLQRKHVESSIIDEEVLTTQTINEPIIEPTEPVNDKITVILDASKEECVDIAIPSVPIIMDNSEIIFPNVTYKTIEIYDWDAEFDAGLTYRDYYNYEFSNRGMYRSAYKPPMRRVRVFEITGNLSNNDIENITRMKEHGYENIDDYEDDIWRMNNVNLEYHFARVR